MTTLWTLIEPLQQAFMLRALIIAVLIAVVCAVLSCYLILKGWALIGDAISHAIFPGVVISTWIGWPTQIGAFVAGLGCVTLTGYLKANSRLKEDTIMGVVFAGFFALGLLLFTKIQTDQHLLHILFGNLLGVSWEDVREVGIVVGIILFSLALKWRDFLLYCFDSVQAQVLGLSTRILHLGFLALLSLAVVAALKAVGVILVIAMLITPGATAFLLTKKFPLMLLLSVLTSVFSSIVGTLLSYFIDASTGPCIILLQAILFFITLFCTELQISLEKRTAKS